MVLSRRFPNDPSSVQRAREYVAKQLRGSHVDLEVAAILTSELATNAVLHANTYFDVSVERVDGIVRVEIVNGAPEMVPAIRDADSDGGRGLRIVEALAVDWGTRSDVGSKGVWFDLPDSA